ncbi:MAG: hypothetical protein CSA13_02150 [Clostridiales bacterium]|nr:MAG: hypothetical protein CSA13_02150 [Clostridiales bacterium]
MKNKIKLIVPLIVFTLLFSLQSAYAAQTFSDFDYATALNQLGLFEGTEKGFELARAATRLEGLTMLTRLLGKCSIINATDYPDSGFNDVPKWGKQTVNYAKSVGLTNGIGNNRFGSNTTLSYQDYATFLLRALELSDQSSWQTAEDDIVRLTNVEQSDILNRQFLRSGVARLSYKALLSKTKNGTLLIVKLVNEGVLDKDDVEEVLNRPISRQFIANLSDGDDNYAVEATDRLALVYDRINYYRPIVVINIDSFERRVFDLVNEEREKNGLDPFLPANRDVKAYANVRVEEIKEKFDHTRPNGESSLKQMHYTTAAENIASGFTSPERVVKGWLNSPGHRANILNPELEYMAVSFSEYNWVQLFYN